MATRIVVSVLVLFSAPTAHATVSSSEQIEIVTVRSVLTAAEKIGARRTGQLCLPAGSTLWSDAAPDWAGVADAVASAMRSRDLNTTTSAAGDDGPPPAVPRRRLSIVISAAHLDACVPQHGLVRLVGGRRKLKVSGTITVRWRLTDPTGEMPVTERETMPILSASDAHSLPDAVTQIIAETVSASVAETLGQ